MENLEWYPVYYNGLETNVEVTKCGRVKKVKVDWYGNTKGAYQIKIGEVDFHKLELNKDYQIITIQIKGLKPKALRVHQLIASAFLGYIFEGRKTVVMHLDNNPINNNFKNLKVGSQRENCSQLRTQKSGLPVGVSFDKEKNKYKAQIVINSKNINLGRYKSIDEASNAYQNKLKSL